MIYFLCKANARPTTKEHKVNDTADRALAALNAAVVALRPTDPEAADLLESLYEATADYGFPGTDL